MSYIQSSIELLCHFFQSIPVIFVNIGLQAIVSYLCLNLIVTPLFIAYQTQLILSVFSVLFFFMNIAFLLILVGLEYLGLAVLLVYAGAIIMILLFIIMLVKLQETENQPFSARAPNLWGANLLQLHTKQAKVKSASLVLCLIGGAFFLTYSCKSIISDLVPLMTVGARVYAPSLQVFSSYSAETGNLGGQMTFENLGIIVPYQPTYKDTALLDETNPNYIPWLFKHFNMQLETKFQPIILGGVPENSWPGMLIGEAPSYNQDRWALNLVGQFGFLNELVPGYLWVSELTDISHKLPTIEGVIYEHVRQLGVGDITTKTWDFYPSSRPWVYSFPERPMEELLKAEGMPQIYAQECELKDQLIFPRKDISNISVDLYTKYSPALVLASLCLFVAMVLSFLLTDFQLR